MVDCNRRNAYFLYAIQWISLPDFKRGLSLHLQEAYTPFFDYVFALFCGYKFNLIVVGVFGISEYRWE
jgi:hypothetical protein